MIIKTNRLNIRLLKESDAQMILDLFNEDNVIKYIGDKGIKNLTDAINYIHGGPLNMQQTLGFSLYCCETKKNQASIGICGLIKRDGIEHVEVGFAFLNKFCGLGFGSESLIAVIKYAEIELNITTLQAITNNDNLASIKLLEKNGFSFNKMIKLSNSENEIKLFEKSIS